jgi:A/G-specific adenine glycosylase
MGDTYRRSVSPLLGGTAGTGSRGGRGTKGDIDRHRRTKGSPKAGEETARSGRGPIPRGFATRLLSWYRAHRRDLPWRRTRDPYRIWVSEVMLQQTTVRAVLPYYEKWLERFPDLASLARAPLRDVLRAWQGLGYYQRARNLHRAAGRILREHGGRLPADRDALRRLPGFGPYTTAAVLSLAFGRPLPVIDANVRRVLMRVLATEGPASSSLDKGFLAVLEKIIPRAAPGAFNQAMMELGALVCRSANPQCLALSRPRVLPGGGRGQAGDHTPAPADRDDACRSRRRRHSPRRPVPHPPTPRSGPPGRSVGVPRREAGTGRKPRRSLAPRGPGGSRGRGRGCPVPNDGPPCLYPVPGHPARLHLPVPPGPGPAEQGIPVGDPALDPPLSPAFRKRPDRRSPGPAEDRLEQS